MLSGPSNASTLPLALARARDENVVYGSLFYVPFPVVVVGVVVVVVILECIAM